MTLEARRRHEAALRKERGRLFIDLRPPDPFEEVASGAVQAIQRLYPMVPTPTLHAAVRQAGHYTVILGEPRTLDGMINVIASTAIRLLDCCELLPPFPFPSSWLDPHARWEYKTPANPRRE